MMGNWISVINEEVMCKSCFKKYFLMFCYTVCKLVFGDTFDLY